MTITGRCARARRIFAAALAASVIAVPAFPGVARAKSVQAAEADAADGGPDLVGTPPTWPKWKVGFVMIDGVVLGALTGFGWWWFRRLIRRRRAGRASQTAASGW